MEAFRALFPMLSHILMRGARPAAFICIIEEVTRVLSRPYTVKEATRVQPRPNIVKEATRVLPCPPPFWVRLLAKEMSPVVA